MWKITASDPSPQERMFVAHRMKLSESGNVMRDIRRLETQNFSLRL